MILHKTQMTCCSMGLKCKYLIIKELDISYVDLRDLKTILRNLMSNIQHFAVPLHCNTEATAEVRTAETDCTSSEGSETRDNTERPAGECNSSHCQPFPS